MQGYRFTNDSGHHVYSRIQPPPVTPNMSSAQSVELPPNVADAFEANPRLHTVLAFEGEIIDTNERVE